MNLTDKQFWLNYWESKEGLVFRIPENFILTELFGKIIPKNSKKTLSSLEIGGFPGHYSIVLKKKYGFDATLLDFVIHPKIIEDLLKINDLKTNEISYIEADLFENKPTKKYNFVFSNGLIEHFEDTKLIIEKHLDYLENEGILFLSLPNFRGLNGWFQKTYDAENYSKHNISSMNIEFLNKICNDLGLKNIKINHYGKFMLWLENYKQQSIFTKIFFKICWFVGKVFFKIIPIETQQFSPYIIITAQK